MLKAACSRFFITIGKFECNEIGLSKVNTGELLRASGTFCLKETQAERLWKEGDMMAMLSTRVLGKIAENVENVYSIWAKVSTAKMSTALRDSTCRSIYLTILSLSCSIS